MIYSSGNVEKLLVKTYQVGKVEYLVLQNTYYQQNQKQNKYIVIA